MISSANRPQHAAQSVFQSTGDDLMFGGLPLWRLARRVGKTPFYAYERAAIKARVAHLRKHLPPSVHLHYAIKANPMPAVVQLLAGLVDGLDVAAVAEMRVALDTAMEPARISFAGPGKAASELASAIAAGIVVNVESEHELRTIARLSEKSGIRARIAVRVNPDFELKSSGMKMSGGPKQFGVDAEQMPQLFRRAKDFDLDFQGLHIFSGSQNLRAEAIIEAQQKSFELALRLAADAPSEIISLNIGGGFGIPYFPGDMPLNLQPIGANLAELALRAQQELPAAHLVVELGRYLVGEAGIYVCRIIDKKISRGQTFLVTDGGLHHHLAASGNFGQVIRKNYPVAIGNRMNSGTTECVNVVGPLCTPLDLLADRMDLPAAEIGDLVVVFQSGAYGLTASPLGFLSHPAPLEVLV